MTIPFENSKEYDIKQLIERCTRNLSDKIEIYTELNQPLQIIDDELAEIIAAKMNDTICGGTGGSGWDNEDGGEVKHSSHVQSKFCTTCNKKSSFHAEVCKHCGENDFNSSKNGHGKKTNPRDGRWGINAESHIKWYPELKEYRLFLLEPETDEPSCRKYRYRYWTIDKDSKHLNAYAKAQFSSKKSNHINFQPLKIDFYLSEPVLKFDGYLTINENNTSFDFNYFNPENTTPEIIPEKFDGKNSEDVLESKKFNKERGKVGRN